MQTVFYRLECATMRTQLQKIREQADLTREGLATLASVTEKTIYNIETIPGTKVQERVRRSLTEALRVRHSALFNAHGIAKLR